MSASLTVASGFPLPVTMGGITTRLAKTTPFTVMGEKSALITLTFRGRLPAERLVRLFQLLDDRDLLRTLLFALTALLTGRGLRVALRQVLVLVLPLRLIQQP